MISLGIRKIPETLGRLDSASAILLIAAGLVAVGLAKDLLLLVLGRDRELLVLSSFLTFRSGTDSWLPIDEAVGLLRTGSEAGLYQTVFFHEHTKFQYPPPSLLPFYMLSLIGVGRGVGFALMKAVSCASVIGIIAATAKLVLDQRALPGLAPFFARPGARWLLIAGAAAGTLTFYPIMLAYQLGQIQVLIDLAVGGTLLAWRHDRKATSGGLMALAALIKPQYGLVLIWSLLRREHRFTLGVLAVGVPAGLLSLLLFGLGEHLSYLSVIAYIGRHGEVFWANQSMNGLLNRLFVDADAMTWDAHAFAPFNPIVYGGTLATTSALVLFALVFRPRWVCGPAAPAASGAVRQESLLDLATMIVALTLASPITWEHHYGVTWPILILALVALVDLRAREPTPRVDFLLLSLGASYVLTSNYLTPLSPLSAAPWNILQSYFFFGGLGLLVVLVGLRAALDPRAAAGRAAPAA